MRNKSWIRVPLNSTSLSHKSHSFPAFKIRYFNTQRNLSLSHVTSTPSKPKKPEKPKKPKKCGFVWNWRLFVKMTDFCWSDGFMYKWRISGIDEEWYLCGSDVLKWRILKWRVLKWRLLKWEIPVNGMMAIFTYQNPRLDIIRYQAFLDDVTPETLRTEFLDDFRSLPTTYYHPVSPQMFQDFIKRWGTHIVKARDQRSN